MANLKVIRHSGEEVEIEAQAGMSAMVLEGRATLQVNGEEQEVGRGTVLFVSATTEHSFFDIEEDSHC